jgi:RNA polymerase sigma factor (TIGR02999 family)
MAQEAADVTKLLRQWSEGDRDALDLLAPLVYDELRRLARAYMVRERKEHSLRATELVHEAFMRLAKQSTPDYTSRAHFLAIAANHMRQILVDHARRRNRIKRGGGAGAAPLDTVVLAADAPSPELIPLDLAMRELEILDARKSRIVEMYFFGGMTLEEIATVLDLHVNTISRDLRFAKAWLKAKLSKSADR